MAGPRFLPYWLTAPAAGLVLGLVLGPIVLLVRVSLRDAGARFGSRPTGDPTLSNYRNLLEADSLKILGFTLIFGAVLAVATVALGYALALVLHSWTPRWQVFGLAVVVAPKLANPLATVFGLKRLLGEAGPINATLRSFGVLEDPIAFWPGPLGAGIAEVYFLLPYVVVLLVLQLARVDPRWPAAARGLGASNFHAFRTITLPLSLPGLLLAGQLSSMWGIGAILGPQFLGNPTETTISVEIQHQAFDVGNWPRAAAWAVLSLVSGFLFAFLGWLTRRLR